MLASNDTLRNIGKNIRKYRELRGLTREQFAEILETDVGYLGQCERGEAQLGISKTVRAIEYFNVSPGEIIVISNKNQENDVECKMRYISDISEIMNGCTINQLAIILRLLRELTPFLKG